MEKRTLNILFIGGDGNHQNANSVCVNNMAREMMSRGHKVWILAMGDENVREAGSMDGAELWQIPDTCFGKMMARNPNGLKFLKFLRHILILPFYPNVAPLRTRKVARKADEIMRKNKIDVVVAIFNDYENINAGVKLKKKYGQGIRVVTYHLDLRTASANPSAFVRKLVHKHTLKSLRKENKTVDKMLIPYSGKKDIDQIAGLDKNKIKYVGFPVFVEGKLIEKCDLPFEKNTINISYIGSLSSDNRNPGYVLSLFEQAEKLLKRKVMVHFWGDMGGLESMIVSSPVAKYHGKIENRFVRYIMDNSDFLLNIGNAISYSMLPSKVFGMFATGKPIINVIAHPHDATLPFFEKYHNSVDIAEYCKSSADASKLADGIVALQGSQCGSSNGSFDDFRPETICDMILNNKI